MRARTAWSGHDIAILGGGLAGLAAAGALGKRAVVLERASRPGGLVRTEHRAGYWFDHVIHLLHFRDPTTQLRIQRLLGPVLSPCRPDAWVECHAGTTRFPFQLHLAGLEPGVRRRSVRDFAAAAAVRGPEPPRDFEEFLLRSFGRAMCETFFFPYNRKMWKRPLHSLAPTDFQWNIARPTLDEVRRGATRAQARSVPYNANGWYPRPPAEADVRGMEVLSRALASEVADLRLGHEVEEVDLSARRIRVRHGGGVEHVAYREACLSTIPLPELAARCPQVPDGLRRRAASLRRNRVLSVALSIRGPRPDLGLWRYYADESICFTRLVFLHAFDPLSAPADGWPLLAEITERAEDPRSDPSEVIARVLADLERVGVLAGGCRVVDATVFTIDPAYVVFSVDAAETIRELRRFFGERGVTPLGRYGRWEYSSMAQVMRDALAWAEEVRSGLEGGGASVAALAGAS